MPPPTDPVEESQLSGYLGWADFATIMGTIIAILTFLGTILKKRETASVHHEEDSKEAELKQLRTKVSEVRSLAEDLDDNYKELKKEIDSLEDAINDMDKAKDKDIKRLEEEIKELKARMDKIIDMIIKLLSEQ